MEKQSEKILRTSFFWTTFSCFQFPFPRECLLSKHLTQKKYILISFVYLKILVCKHDCTEETFSDWFLPKNNSFPAFFFNENNLRFWLFVWINHLRRRRLLNLEKHPLCLCAVRTQQLQRISCFSSHTFLVFSPLNLQQPSC